MLRPLRRRLLDDGRARERHVLAQPHFFPLKQDANGGALGPSERALHLLARDELHADKVNFENSVAHAHESAAGGGSCGFQARNLVESVIAANELHADAAGGTFRGCFHSGC